MKTFPSRHRPITFLRSKQLICDGCSLFNSEFVLTNTSQEVNAMPLFRETDQRLLVAVLIFNHGGTRISMWTSDNPLPHLVEVGRSDSLRECKFSSEHGWYSDFIGFDIDVWRDD